MRKTKGCATDRDIEIGAMLRQVRNLRGLSQTELAEKIGITFQQVQKYEKGTNRISASRLEAICAVLSVPVTQFFPANDDKPIVFGKDALRLIRAYERCDERSQGIIVDTVERVANV